MTLAHSAEPHSARRALAAIGIATLAVSLWTIFVRSVSVESPVSLEGLERFGFEPYLFGLAAQELAVPLVLLFLVSRLGMFRRVVVDQASARDERYLALLFVVVQILFFLYRWNRFAAAEESVTWGYFVVFAAALLGGWPNGLLVGVLGFLSEGGLEYIEFRLWESGPVPTAEIVEYFFLKNIGAVAAIWVGFVVGWWANWRRERRFVLWQVLLLGFAIEMGSFLFLVFSNDFNEFFIERLLTNVVISGVAIATVVLIVRTLQQEESRRRIKADQLDLAQTRLTLTSTQLALTQAELRALHAQINPHFLFNSLNTINHFIRTDPEKARDLLGRLSEIFQRVLNAGDQVPLREEIGLVEAYLALEKARLEDRLNIVWTNLARETEDSSVPSLILQPIVENAVVHGIAPQEEGGTVHILLDRVEGELLVQVTDDGAGFDATSVLTADSESEQEGTAGTDSIGLRNVDRRLRMLFGDDHGLRIESQDGQGTRVVFRIPVEQKSA